MKGKRLGMSTLLIRIVFTVAIGSSLFVYGGLERHAALAFIGGLALGYASYGIRIAMMPLQGMRTTREIIADNYGPFYSQLRWQTNLTMRKCSSVMIRLEESWRIEGSTDGIASSIRVCWPGLKRKASCIHGLEFPTRGRYTLESIEMTVGDLWGWFQKSITQSVTGKDKLQAYVLPSTAYWDDASMWSQQGMSITTVGSPSETRGSVSGLLSSELRPYQLGDSHRSIHWRYYAKHRELAVRARSIEEQPESTFVIDDLSIVNGKDAEQLERLLDRAAYECCSAWRAEREVRLLFISSEVLSQGQRGIAERIVLFSEFSEQRLQAEALKKSSCSNGKGLALAPQVKGSEVTVLSSRDKAWHINDLPGWLHEVRIKDWRTIAPVSPSQPDQALMRKIKTKGSVMSKQGGRPNVPSSGI